MISIDRYSNSMFQTLFRNGNSWSDSMDGARTGTLCNVFFVTVCVLWHCCGRNWLLKTNDRSHSFCESFCIFTGLVVNFSDYNLIRHHTEDSHWCVYHFLCPLSVFKSPTAHWWFSTTTVSLNALLATTLINTHPIAMKFHLPAHSTPLLITLSAAGRRGVGAVHRRCRDWPRRRQVA